MEILRTDEIEIVHGDEAQEEEEKEEKEEEEEEEEGLLCVA